MSDIENQQSRRGNFNPEEQVLRDRVKEANKKIDDLHAAFMAETNPVKKDTLTEQRVEAEAELAAARAAILNRKVQ